MATTFQQIEDIVRDLLHEPQPRFWSSDELRRYCISGVRDLWRSLVDLKQEYFLTRDNTNVTLAASTATLTGVPSDVHKVYLIEARDLSSTSSNKGLHFKPLDYNHPHFQAARSLDNVDPSNAVIYYAITGAGGPVNATTIYVAPKVTSAVNLSFVYVPTFAATVTDSLDNIPIPGECDNALVAWTVAYARSKEREDRSPDPNWIATYSTEKTNLLHSLGLRQLQEPQVVDAMFEEFWS